MSGSTSPVASSRGRLSIRDLSACKTRLEFYGRQKTIQINIYLYNGTYIFSFHLIKQNDHPLCNTHTHTHTHSLDFPEKMQITTPQIVTDKRC